MKNKQKFLRGQSVRLRGQPNSPSMTVTKIFRHEEESQSMEKTRTFSYECSWWENKKQLFHRLVFDEESLEKVRETPKINKNKNVSSH